MVRELIAKLSKMDQELPVVIHSLDDGDQFNVDSIEQSVAIECDDSPEVVCLFLGECLTEFAPTA